MSGSKSCSVPSVPVGGTWLCLSFLLYELEACGSNASSGAQCCVAMGRSINLSELSVALCHGDASVPSSVLQGPGEPM